VKTAPDECPFCESPIMIYGGNLLRSDNCGFATYECRTVYDVELADNQWKRAEQSVACRTRENQLLTKQRDEAREYITEIEQICGKVLDYPWYKNDQENFPGSTEVDGVCVGEHIAETIASELARKYTELKQRIKRLEAAGDEILNANNHDEQYEAMAQSQGGLAVKYPSYRCQKCGELIGWIGRFMFPFFHQCRKKEAKP